MNFVSITNNLIMFIEIVFDWKHARNRLGLHTVPATQWLPIRHVRSLLDFVRPCSCGLWPQQNISYFSFTVFTCTPSEQRVLRGQEGHVSTGNINLLTPRRAVSTDRARIHVQVTIYRRLLIGRDGHLDQSEAYDISYLIREYGPRWTISAALNAILYPPQTSICLKNTASVCVQFPAERGLPSR